MSEKLYMPLITSAPTLPPPIEGEADHPTGFRMDYMTTFYDFMVNDPDQGRKEIKLDSILTVVAQVRVKSMAEHGWSGHVDPLGHGPDWYVRDEGYKLPGAYGKDPKANHIESISYGGWWGTTALSIWQGLMGDEDHRNHLLGRLNFAQQTHVGIAVYYKEDSIQKQYVSIITAPPQPH